MAFTKALYYPWIDIQDEAWLKNAMVYWEGIQTIVPVSIQQPYSTRTAMDFCDQGLLTPLHVQSDMVEINELTTEVMKYLESPEGIEVLMERDITDYQYIHPDKLPADMRRLVDIHPEKLPYEIRHMIEKASRGDWLRVDSRFADFYMTLLATRLSDRSGSALLTPTPSINKLATAVKLDARLTIPSLGRHRFEYDEREYHTQMPISLAQGALADLILENIQIDPETPVEKILSFRRAHSDELGQFRTKIADLTKSISAKLPLAALRQQTADIYLNEVKPAMNNLARGLTDSRIKWTTENFLRVAFFSTSSTSIPLAMLGLSVPQALLVGAGVSLTASAILYNRDKQDKLRQNPYAYLLAVERELH